MPWAREEADSDSFDPAWLDETRTSVDVRFDDDTRDGAVRLRIFARLAASYSGGAQPVSGELRRVLSTAERCVADDPGSASDVATCASPAQISVRRRNALSWNATASAV